jgi:diguanylate cyclase (GGDEF)-like protein
MIMAIAEDKVELLRKVDVFSTLREYELDIIAGHSEFITVKKGRPIFSQGTFAREFYVLSTGRVGIISLENGDAKIAQISGNESFGELDFIARTERSVAAFAEEDSVLLMFPAKGQVPKVIFGKHPYIFAVILHRILGIISERIWNVNQLLQDRTGWLKDLRRQLHRDKITGLYNRIFLDEDFVNLLPEIGRGAALLMIKPDNFKEINDRFGHDAGDQALNLMAIFLQSELLENDIGVRYGGDEYAAVLADADGEKAVARADSLRRTYGTIDLSGITGTEGMRIKVSIGIALYPDDADNSADLVAAAHNKMIKARVLGGDTIII